VSLTELERLSIDDVELANEALDAWTDAERSYYRKRFPR
jgi:hypothetical protein